jgi:autotransporter translocation and assembly factor TamB
LSLEPPFITVCNRKQKAEVSFSTRIATLKSSQHKLLKWGVLLLLIGLALMTGIYAFRSVLVAPYAISFLERIVASNFGLQVSIGRLGGTYFSDLEIENVTTVKRIKDSAISFLELRRLKIAFSLSDLLKGLPAFLAGAHVDMEGAFLNIDLTRPSDSDKAHEAPTGIPLPPQLPQIGIRNSSIRIQGKNYQTEFKGILLTARNQNLSTSRIQLRVSEWSWSHPDLRDAAIDFETDLLFAGERVTLTKLLVGKQSLVESVTIDLSGLPEQLPFQARLNLADGKLEASGNLDKARLQVQLDGSAIDLSQISGMLASHVAPFAGILTVGGHLDLPLESLVNMAVDVDVQVSNGSVNSIIVDELAGKFIAENGRLLIADLRLMKGDNRVMVQQASVPAGVAFTGEPDALLQSLAANWELECADIPSLLKLVGVALETQGGPIPSHRLVLSGRIDNGNVVIPDGRLETDVGYIRLKSAHITLPMSDHPLADAPLEAVLAVNLPDLKPLSRIFTLPALGGSLSGHLQVMGTLDAPRVAVDLKANGVSYQNTVFGNLAVNATADVHQVIIKSCVLTRGKDRAMARGTVNWVSKAFEGFQLEFDVTNLKPYFLELAPLVRAKAKGSPDVRGRLAGAINISGPFTQPVGTVKLQSHGIRINGTRFGDANVKLSLSSDRVVVSSAEFRNSNDRVIISGSFHHQRQQLDNVDVKLDIKNLAVYIDPWWRGKASVSGSVRGHLKASGNFLEPDASAEIQVENFLANDINIEKGKLRLRSTGRQTTIERAEVKTAQGSVRIAGTIRRNATDTEFNLQLNEAVLTHQDIVVSLEKPSHIRLSRNGMVYFDKTSLSGSVGRLTLSGRFDPTAESDLLIAIAGARSDGWFDRVASNRIRFQGLDAQIRIGGPLDSPSVTVTGLLDQLGSPEMPMMFAGRFNLSYSDKTVTIREFVWNSAGGQQVNLKGSFPLDPFGANLLAPGRITLTGGAEITNASTLDFLVPWYGVTGGSIKSDLKLSGTWDRPIGELHLRVHNLSQPQDINPLPPEPYDITGDIRIDGEQVVLELFEARSPGLLVQAEGQWNGAPSPVDLLRSKGRKLTGRVNLKGSLDAPDLSWLARQVAGVRRLAGRLEVRGRLQGPVTDLTADGTIRLSDGELSPDIDMPSLREMSLEAAVTPEALKVQTLVGELGGAPFTLTGTYNLAAAGHTTDFRLKGENLLLFRGESVRLRADTDLTLKGPVSRLELAGEIAITDGHFSKNFGVLEGLTARGKPDTEKGFQLFSIREAPLRDMKFNVRITAREAFRIQNNLVRGAVRPDLVLSGTGEVPVITGKVYVEPTRFYLPAGRMKLETGIIRFDPNDPDRPKLDMVGTTKMLGYDITAVVDGPYDEPVITLSSVPPLPNEDLVMLLLTGQPPKKSGLRDARRSQQMNVATFLGRDMISQLFGGESEEADEFILDRFDVEIGRGVTQQGEETIHAQFRLADDILRKGDSLYLTGERDYFDYYNAGVRIVFRFR